MYLYLGTDVVKRAGSIVGVFDTDNATAVADTREFLAAAQRNGEIVDISGDLPKAFVLCAEKGEKRVYLSQVSSATLEKRAARAEKAFEE